MKMFHCGLFDTMFVFVEVYDRHAGVVIGVIKNLDINCLWKPKLHPACNCTRALLNYINPDGLCSPTCIETPFAHTSKGYASAHKRGRGLVFQ